MKNRIILIFICLVVSQPSLFAQDRYAPISELTQLFETSKTVEDISDVAIPSTNELTLENQNLVRVYPTQVYSFAQVEFRIPKDGDAIIGVYDLDDNKIKSIAFNHFEAGIYTKTIQTKNLKKGVYYVKLNMKGYTETKRLIIAR